MSTLPKQGDRFVYDGLILEAQESQPTCEGCYFKQRKGKGYYQCLRGKALPDCADLAHYNDIIYKYVREATDEEIRKGVTDV